MLERLTDRARTVLGAADGEARGLGHGHLGTEHLLLGLLAAGDSPAAAVLGDAGATLAGARQKAREAVSPQRDSGPAPGELPMTARARRALDRADRFSLQRKQPLVSTEHLLLGVLDVEGTAGQILRGLGVDVARLRDVVDGTHADPPTLAGPGAAALPMASPRCPACSADIGSVLAHRSVSSRGDGEPDRRLVVAYCAGCGAVLGATPA